MTPQQKLEQEFGESIGRTEISLYDEPHAVFRTGMLRFLRKMQAKTGAAFVRREMARRVAERILYRACVTAEPEVTLNLAFKRLTRLGFSSIEARVTTAAMLGRWVQLGKEDSLLVRPFIADTARRVRCLKRGRLKREAMKDIDLAMVRTGMKPG